jgi:hypothetical protein
LNDETIDRTVWSTGFRRSYGPVLRQYYRMDKCNKFQVSRQVLMKICNIIYQENQSSVSRTDASGLADGKTDMTKMIIFYREHANRPSSKGVRHNLVGP